MEAHPIRYEERAAVQARLAEALRKFEKDYLGRSLLQVEVHFWNELVILRLHNVLTPAERKLAKEPAGRALIKKTRRKLFESARPVVGRIVEEELGVELLSMHTDISTRTGERIVVLTVDCNLEVRFGPESGMEPRGEGAGSSFSASADAGSGR